MNNNYNNESGKNELLQAIGDVLGIMLRYLSVSLVTFVALVIFFFYLPRSLYTSDVRSLENQIPVEKSNLNILQTRKITLFNEFVSTIKESSAREEEILAHIVELRSSGSSDTSAISITSEAYPELKSVEGYNKFMTEMAITENGIASQRKSINDLVLKYNNYFTSWPSSVYLSGYDKQEFGLYLNESTTNSDEWTPNWK